MVSSVSVTSLLHDRRIALYWSGLLLSQIGSSMWRIALPWLAISLTGSSIGVATTLLVTLLPALIVGPAAGALADRFPRQKAIIGLDLGRAILFGIAFVIVQSLTGWSAVFALSGIALIESLATTWYSSARVGVMKALATEGHGLQALSALDRTTNNIANLAGLVLGGVAIVSFGINRVLLINSISFVIAGVSALIAGLPSGQLGQRGQGESRLAFAVAGLRHLHENWSARQVVIAQAGLNLVIPLVVLGLPILASEEWRSAKWLGLASGAFAAGGLVASLLTGFRSLKAPTLLTIWGAVSVVAAMVFVTAVTNKFIALPALFVAGFVSNALGVVLLTNLQSAVIGSLIGRVFALSSMANQATAAAVILTMSVLVSPQRFSHAMAIAAGVLVLFALVYGGIGGMARLTLSGPVMEVSSTE
ncbi:MAG TPA: MFS transporter [Candidatus Nanopelagicaceae bacterium]|nr:MFS transporter [Candidatus Nanopelagicaceae bacterium]